MLQGYHVLTGLYGHPFNGYMGILTAWPTRAFDVMNVDINRLSDTAEAWPDKQPEGWWSRAYQSFLAPPLQFVGLSKEKKKEESHWEMAKYKKNVVLVAKLKDKISGREFCIGNYHMPYVLLSVCRRLL